MELEGILERIETRVRAQAKDLRFYPVVEDAVKYAEKLPPVWGLQTDHLISVIMNRPSYWDHWVAENIMEKTVGKLFKGQAGLWDAQRVKDLS